MRSVGERRVVDVEAEVVGRWKAGEKVSVLAAEFGVADRTVRRWLGKAGLSAGVPVRTAENDWDAMAAAYRCGVPVVRIAERFGVDPKTVRRAAGRAGVGLRPFPKRAAFAGEVLERYRRGEQLATIARELKISRSTAYRIIEESGSGGGRVVRSRVEAGGLG